MLSYSFKWFTRVLRVLFMHLFVLQYTLHHTVYTLIMCFLKPHLSEYPSFCSHTKDILNLTHTLFCLWCIVSYSNICRILVPAFIFLSRGEKCEYLEINLCNGDKLYWSPNVCFPWQLGFLRPGVLCFILTESCYWCFWFGSDWGEAFGKCSTVL